MTSTLFDQYGKKINYSRLSKSIAEPSPMSFGRSVFAMESAADGLTPARLGQILAAAGDQNDGIAYLTLAEEMEERDAHYRSVLTTRKMAITSLPVKVIAPTDDPRDVEMADFITSVTDRPEFAEMIEDLVDALGKGYSVIEILWDRDGQQWVPRNYKWRDPRFFRFDSRVGEECLLIDETDPTKAYPLEPYKFIVHRPRLKSGLSLRGGLARAVAGIYMWKSFSLRDWGAFGERFGMPLRLGKYPSGTDPAEIDKLFQAVSQMGIDSAAVISEGMSIDFVNTSTGGGGESLYLQRCEFLDRQTSKCVLGQTLTTDAGGSAISGGGPAGQHGLVRGDIRDADATQANRTLNRYLTRPLIDLNFGPVKAYPRIELQPIIEVDLDAEATRLFGAIDHGAEIEQSYMADTLGYPVAAPGAKIMRAKVSGGGFGGSGVATDAFDEANAG